MIISLSFALNNNTSISPVGSYWTDSTTSKLVSEVLLALEQQQQQQHDEEQEAVYWAGISSSIRTEQQLLTFWRRVIPSAEALSCYQY